MLDDVDRRWHRLCHAVHVAPSVFAAADHLAMDGGPVSRTGVKAVLPARIEARANGIGACPLQSRRRYQ
jgi:hypothetical protein